MTKARRSLLRAALSAASIVAVVGLAELALAAAGVRPGWRYCRGWARDDLRLRYRLTPGDYPDLFSAPVHVNGAGLRDAEPARPLTAALVGDSVVFGVGVPGPLTAASLLSRRPGEVANAGVPGYNTFIGRAWLAEVVGRFHPRVVFIYFGWNDHWRAAAPERWFYAVRRLATRSRLASLALRAFQPSLFDQSPAERRHWIAQVPLGEFRRNLEAMVAQARASGATAVLVTPASDASMTDDEPFLRRRPGEFADHAPYVEAVRQTARKTGSDLADFDAVARAALAARPRKPLFLDFAHLSPAGHRLLAATLRPWVDRARNASRTR